jgi:hypothetical protein
MAAPSTTVAASPSLPLGSPSPTTTTTSSSMSTLPPLDAPVGDAALARSRSLPAKPEAVTLRGRFLDLVPYDPSCHLAALWSLMNGSPALGHPKYDPEGLVWRYLWGAPASVEELGAKLGKIHAAPDARLWVVRLKDGSVEGSVDESVRGQGTAIGGGNVYGVTEGAGAAAGAGGTGSPMTTAASPTPPSLSSLSSPPHAGGVVGTIGLIANRPENLCVEVAYVLFTPAYQGTPATTEATFLLLQHAFDTLGYRRVEWKTNTLNARSRAAALRLGFVHEGVFRHHFIVQGGHSRDTAWYSMIEGDWETAKGRTRDWIMSGAPGELYARRRREMEVGEGVAAGPGQGQGAGSK